MAGNLINVVCMQVGWFAAVLSMAAGAPLLGLLAVVILVVAQGVCNPRRREWLFVALVALCGAVADSVVSGLGWVVAGVPDGVPALISFAWFAGLWANFATTLTRSLSWLRNPWTAALLGAVGGPAAYFGAQQLGALSLPAQPVPTTLLLASYWALAMPGALALARALSGAGEAAIAGSAGRDSSVDVATGKQASPDSPEGAVR